VGSARGQARLSGAFGQVAGRFGYRGGPQLIRVGAVHFRIHNGAIEYDNFTLTFGSSFDLRSRGAVRFNDSIDLSVSVPIRPALLRDLGVRGDTERYAALLAGSRVEIPIVGSRLAPKLDLAKVNIAPLIEKAAAGMVSQQAGGVLGGVLGGGKATPLPNVPPEVLPNVLPNPFAKRPPATQPASMPAAKEPAGGLLKDLFHGLGGLVPKDKQDGK